MDLTGTSLSDVLPLEAPRWPSSGEVTSANSLDLTSPPPPDLFWGEGDTFQAIEARRGPGDPSLTVGVPYLGDYLLFATPDWDGHTDVPLASLMWRHRDLPNLKVIPSSALPADLERILPVVYDEERAAFLESRLEALIIQILTLYPGAALVIDTPPTIPGLSRTVLSLALRLGLSPRCALAEDDDLPDTLQKAEIRWRAWMVASTDTQDLRATERWLEKVQVEEEPVIGCVINRAISLEPGDKDAVIGRALPHLSNPLVDRAVWLKRSDAFAFFSADSIHHHIDLDTEEQAGLDALLAGGMDWLEART